MSEPLSAPALHLTGTRVAEYFRFACERQLRYDLMPADQRPVQGGMRPGTGLLAAAGRRWERRKVLQLLRRFGAERVVVDGWTAGGSPRRIPAERVVELLREPGRVEVLVQPELQLVEPERFAARFGLDAERLRIAAAVPDLIRIRRGRDGSVRFQVADIKGSAAARIPHYAQVAYYSLLLEAVCVEAGIDPARVDRRWGRVWARDGRGPRRFPLPGYRHHVAEVLRRDLARVMEREVEQCAWHLSPRCAGCPYFGHCRAEGDQRDDLARVVGITPLAKEVLRGKGIRSAGELANNLRRDTYRGCHALESQAERLQKRAQAVRFGKVFDVETRTHLMPRAEDVRVILTAEGDPVSGRCFALGIKVESEIRLAHAPPLGIWIAEDGSARGEAAILHSLLTSVERVLRAADGAGRGSGGRRAGLSVHFYVYDRAELDLLREALLRHLADGEARPMIARLLRFLSPRAVTLQPDVVRSAPGTVVAEVVSALFALPVPYAYDLAAVSDRLRPSQGDWRWRPRPDYAWPFSSQVAFERIHNVWRRRPHRGAGGEQSPEEVGEEVRQAVASKLAAIDSVIRAVRERAQRKDRLQMRKEPLSLVADEEPLADPQLEALRVFAELESAAEATQVRALHVLPAAERAQRFECLRGMELVERRADGALVFSFDPDCRDVKFRVGEFNLVLTNDDERSLLEADRLPWKRRRLMMELLEYDMAASPPRVVLGPSSGFARAEEERWIDLDRVCVLDRAPSDFNTARVLATLRALAEGHGEAGTIRSLLRGQEPPGWAPAFGDADAAFEAVLQSAAARLERPVLNAHQEAAWRSVFRRPVSLIWGPPGTGKTYLLAWTLIGLAASAHREGKPCRILVTAATHRAIANALARLAAELRAAGLAVPLRIAKLRGSGSDTDAELQEVGVELLPDRSLPAVLDESERGAPLVVGSTVWSLWKQMRAAGEEEDGQGSPPVRPWFDVVVVDEASQMKVAEALIALSSVAPRARVVFCGDDKQLRPVTRGDYPEEAGTLFGSVFEHLAASFPRLALRESRRMNAALVDYPRRVFYPGLVSMRPRHRVALAAPEAEEDALLREHFLDPDAGVVLCTYRGPRATARNPFEAALAARLALLARRALLDPVSGSRYDDARFVSEGVAVISPHRAQNSAILAELRRLGLRDAELPVVDTVERMQGNERELIIVSYGVADREYAEAEAGFLLDPNRFNVAITRARAKVIVLLSEEVLAAIPGDERVLAGSMTVKGYAAHCRDGEVSIALADPDGAQVDARIRYRRIAR